MDKKNIVVAEDDKGHKVVVINEILFHGKRSIPWDKVEEYLKKYIGDIVEVAETKEKIHIDKDFPDELKGSEDTQKVKGANARAKANSVQGIRQMIHISRKVSENENMKLKNKKKASKGWYRYLTRFALPIMPDGENIEYYNTYLVTLIVRVDKKGILYLYDVINVKKERSFQIKE